MALFVRRVFGRRGIGATAVALLIASLVMAAPASADVTITSPGPLEELIVSPDLNCSVRHVGDSSGEWYGDTACGTFVSVGGVLYGPASVPAGGGATNVDGYTAFTPVSQSGPVGTGTAADPYVLTTVVDLGTSGLRLSQRDYYQTGQDTTRNEVTITNTGAARNAIVYRAGDCYLQDSDTGLGAIVGAAPTCKAAPDSVNPERIQQLLPLTTGSHYMEGNYNDVWSGVGTGTQLPDTCRCDSNDTHDNALGLSWGVALPASGTATVASITAFSPVGAQPLQVTKSVAPTTVDAGGTVTYTITVNNPGAVPATLATVSDTLPDGFTYQAGTTTGAVTTDPAMSGQTLTWSGPVVVAGGGSAALSFAVRVSDVAGDYLNSATGSGEGLTVIGADQVAPVQVNATTTTSTTEPPTTTTEPPTTTTEPPTTTSTTEPTTTSTTEPTTTSTTEPTTTSTTEPTTTSTSTTPPYTTTTSTPPYTTTTTTPPGGECTTDELSIHLWGGVSGSYNGCVNSGDLRIVRDNNGIRSVTGAVKIPSFKPGSSGEATVRVDVQRVWILPIHFGTATIKDQSAGIHVTAYLFLGPVNGHGSTAKMTMGGVTGSWWNLRFFEARLDITDLG